MSDGDSLRGVIVQCVDSALARDVAIQPMSIVVAAQRERPDLFVAESERLVTAAALAIAKRVLRSYADDADDEEEQVALPGLSLPAAIAVPEDGGGYYYVPAERATWSDLQAGREVRQANVGRAQGKLDRYDETCAMLRPYMEPFATRTVAEAVPLLATGRRAACASV